MANVREHIEIDYYTNGRLVKHPSGVQKFELLETLQWYIDNAILGTCWHASCETAIANCEAAEEAYE